MLNRKKITSKLENSFSNKAAKKVAMLVLAVQCCFASFMNSKTKALTAKGQLRGLVSFCVLFGGWSIYVLVGTFKNIPQTIKPSQVVIPKYYDRAGLENSKSTSIEKDIKRVVLFRKQMDSLRVSPSGKMIYDAILKTRPGLMDSINKIEEVYYSNSK